MHFQVAMTYAYLSTTRGRCGVLVVGPRAQMTLTRAAYHGGTVLEADQPAEAANLRIMA